MERYEHVQWMIKDEKLREEKNNASGREAPRIRFF